MRSTCATLCEQPARTPPSGDAFVVSCLRSLLLRICLFHGNTNPSLRGEAHARALSRAAKDTSWAWSDGVEIPGHRAEQSTFSLWEDSGLAMCHDERCIRASCAGAKDTYPPTGPVAIRFADSGRPKCAANTYVVNCCLPEDYIPESMMFCSKDDHAHQISGMHVLACVRVCACLCACLLCVCVCHCVCMCGCARACLSGCMSCLFSSPPICPSSAHPRAHQNARGVISLPASALTCPTPTCTTVVQDQEQKWPSRQQQQNLS